VVICRKAIRSLRLRVLPNGTATLSAPYFVSDRTVNEFLLAKRAWLAAAVSRAVPPRDCLLLFGQRLALKTQAVPAKKEERLTVTGKEAILFLTDEARRDTVLAAARRGLLQTFLAEHVPLWEEKTGLRAAKWQIRDMRSRWGSCTVKTREIRFALKLSERTPEEIDAVILHELCHIAVPNHGAAFQEQMSRFLPEWRRIQKQMRA